MRSPVNFQERGPPRRRQPRRRPLPPEDLPGPTGLPPLPQALPGWARPGSGRRLPLLPPAAQDEVLLGPGHRHVLEAVVLLPFRLLLPLLQRPVARGVEAPLPRQGVVERNPEAHVPAENLLVMFRALRAAEVCQDHHRELQPLRGVDGHEFHGVLLDRFHRRLRLANLGTTVAFQHLHELRERSPSTRLPPPHQVHQLSQIREPAPPVEMKECLPCQQ